MGPNYDDGFADGAASRSADRNFEAWLKLFGQGLLLLGRAAYFGLLYSPLLFSGYLVSHALPGVHHHNRYGQALLIGSVAYLVYSALFFLKGLQLAFQHRQPWVSWLLLVPCLLGACGIPALIVHVALQQWLPTLSWVWNWVAALAVATLVYQRYQFLTPGAPPLAQWAYQVGLSLPARPLPTSPNPPTP